jgi:hypothetical protein
MSCYEDLNSFSCDLYVSRERVEGVGMHVVLWFLNLDQSYVALAQ